MTRFEIKRSDPVVYKEKILEFWKEYLPGTPSERFDWMQNNPAGESIWLLAFDSSSNELVGMITIMLHEITIQGKSLRSGIVGDFMISDKCRVFGPAMHLLEAAVDIKDQLNINFLYTVPNQASMKLATRMGFVEKIKMHTLVRPLKSEPYINGHVKNALFKKTLTILIDRVLKRLPIWPMLSKNDNFEIATNVDEAFDDLWAKIKSQSNLFIGNHGTEYLKWRYCQNSQNDFKFLKYTCEKTGEMYGYIVYCIYENKILIYDYIAQSNVHINKLLIKLFRLASDEDHQAIYIMLPESNNLFRCLKKFMFFDAKDDISVLMREDENNFNYEDWCFLSGDRNI